MIRLIRRHVVVCILSGHFGLDWQEVSDRLDNSLGNIADMGAQLFHKAVKQVPRSSLDTHVVVVHESHEILQNLGNVYLVVFEDGAVSNANFHILQHHRRVREAGDA